MKYHVRHATTYAYGDPVSVAHNVAHLTPRDSPHQRCRSSRVIVKPAPAVSAEHTDYFGNRATFFTVQEPHRVLEVVAEYVIEVDPTFPPDPTQSPPWEQVRDSLPGDRSTQGLEAYQYCFDSPYIQLGSELRDYARPSFPCGRPLLEALLDLNRRIHADYTYDTTATTLATPLREMFVNRRGVCQDFAHLGIGCLRSLGLPARYVSGYLSTTPPPGRPRLIGADASHAWLSAYCHGFGWCDVDPTNDCVPSDRHVTLAWGRDYDDVSPVKGVILDGGPHVVRVGVDVIPEHELTRS